MVDGITVNLHIQRPRSKNFCSTYTQCMRDRIQLTKRKLLSILKTMLGLRQFICPRITVLAQFKLNYKRIFGHQINASIPQKLVKMFHLPEGVIFLASGRRNLWFNITDMCLWLHIKAHACLQAPTVHTS